MSVQEELTTVKCKARVATQLVVSLARAPQAKSWLETIVLVRAYKFL